MNTYLFEIAKQSACFRIFRLAGIILLMLEAEWIWIQLCKTGPAHIYKTGNDFRLHKIGLLLCQNQFLYFKTKIKF